MLSNPLFSWSNAFVGAIARPSPCRETRQQKGLDLAHWPQRFRNSPYIVGRNDSNLDVSSPNTGRETKSLEAVRRIQSSLGTGRAFDLWPIILRPTWWLSAGFRSCISLADLERRRERELEPAQGPQLRQGSEPPRQ